ncbi:hypothetical protein BraRD5C2_38960 [Bradyrhizobium sp. RD5-C2]|nr:hypothetical protein BraRD5C2_38960 [Bradyrhizobium sp. RD5-C2]
MKARAFHRCQFDLREPLPKFTYRRPQIAGRHGRVKANNEMASIAATTGPPSFNEYVDLFQDQPRNSQNRLPSDSGLDSSAGALE